MFRELFFVTINYLPRYSMRWRGKWGKKQGILNSRAHRGLGENDACPKSIKNLNETRVLKISTAEFDNSLLRHFYTISIMDNKRNSNWETILKYDNSVGCNGGGNHGNEA